MNMKKKQLEKLAYRKPICSVIPVCAEGPLCVSVTPNAGASSEAPWGGEQTHEGGVIIGDGTGLAPAKQQPSWNEE